MEKVEDLREKLVNQIEALASSTSTLPKEKERKLKELLNKSFPVMLYNKEESNVLLLKRPLLLCMYNLHQVNQIYRAVALAEEPK